MAAQVLVMCAACHRPQLSTQKRCVHCGADLPDAPVAKEQLRSARDALLASYEPYLEATLGGGRRILLSERRLEWCAGPNATIAFDLPRIRKVRLTARPVWEALIFGGLFALGLALAPWLWAKAVFGGLLLLAVVACVAQKRYALVIDGEPGCIEAMLGIGTPKSPIAQRIVSVWGTVREELAKKNVRCEG